MKRKQFVTAVALAMLTSSTLAEEVRVSVTIENLAPKAGTSQTPHWVGFHDGVAFDIYNGNTPASTLPISGSVAVERLAEDGNADPLADDFALLQPDGADDVITGPNGPLRPGEYGSGSFLLDSENPAHRYFSYASMVLPSNDFWYANGNPKAHLIFDDAGNFVAKDFIVTRDDILDAGTEVNTEVPEETAFFGQSVPNTGLDEGGVILDFNENDPNTFFLRPGSGGILDDARFAMADFLIDGYPLVKISFKGVPAITDELRFATTMAGFQEVPPVRTRGYGWALYSLQEAGTRLVFQHETNLGARQIVAAHLHLGAKGENGPVVASLFTDANRAERVTRLPLGRPGRSRIDGELTTADLTGPLAGYPLDSLIAQMREGNVYVNIHTRRFPDGEIRGQVAEF